MLRIRHITALLMLPLVGTFGCRMDGQYGYWYGAPHHAMTEAATQLRKSRTEDPALILSVFPGNIGRAPGPGESMTLVAWRDGSILTVDNRQRPIVCTGSREDIARIVTGVSAAGIFRPAEDRMLVGFPPCSGFLQLQCNRGDQTGFWTASDEVLEPDWATSAEPRRDTRVDWLLQTYALRCVE